MNVFTLTLYSSTNDCYTGSMTVSATREQTGAMTHQASTLVTEASRALDSLTLLLENPGRNSEHAYVEMVRLASQLRDLSQVHAEILALTAYQGPSNVSLRRLAAALGMSVNTLRRRISGLTAEATDPFAEGSSR